MVFADNVQGRDAVGVPAFFMSLLFRHRKMGRYEQVCKIDLLHSGNFILAK